MVLPPIPGIFEVAKQPPQQDEIRIIFEERTNAPKIDRRRTLLFLSRPEKHDCNSVTMPKYRKNILLALQWEQEHGISTFVVDYATPLGILTLETLLDERKKVLHSKSTPYEVHTLLCAERIGL